MKNNKEDFITWNDKSGSKLTNNIFFKYFNDSAKEDALNGISELWADLKSMIDMDELIEDINKQGAALGMKAGEIADFIEYLEKSTSKKKCECGGKCHGKRNNGNNVDEAPVSAEKSKADKVSMVNHPPHYNSGKIEVIDIMLDQFGFEHHQAHCLMTALKYICRCGKKDAAKSLEDIEKADWYLRRYIKIAKEHK